MENTSEKWKYIMLPAQDEQGGHVLSIIAKRTYVLAHNTVCIPSAEQRPLTPGDVYYNNGNPLTTSCELESDNIPFKVATDVVFNGKAYAPGQREVDQLIVQLKVGDVDKKIVVTGNRSCLFRQILDPVFSAPEPFLTMDIRFENAYGGTDVQSVEGQEFMYPRNPIGKGFVVKKKRESIDGLQLPNLEDPEDMLVPGGLVVDKMKNWEQFPIPQSFGWYGKSWFPRATFAGVMPADTLLYDEIREAYTGYVPKEHIESFKKLKMNIMDFRFFNGASPGLSMPFLTGEEKISLRHLDPNYPEFIFQLPGEKPQMGIDFGFGKKDFDAVLHTVMIEKEKNVVCLTWRGSLPYEGPEAFQHFTDFNVVVE